MMTARIRPGIRKALRVADTLFGLAVSREEITRPIFVLGCGRSGTTILGTTLSYHPQVTYLNERRDLWSSAYPATDIWSRFASRRSGKLHMTAADVRDDASVRLRRLFQYQVSKTGSQSLVEKLPINNFRLGFIEAIFPDALYIHIQRHGIEVASSIQREAKEGWYSKYAYRWKLLTEYAASMPETAALPELCEDDYERGLLEWRLSLDALHEARPEIDDSRFFHLTYRDLVDTPKDTMQRVLSFVGLPNSSEMLQFADSSITRKHCEPTERSYTKREQKLGGRWLEEWSE